MARLTYGFLAAAAAALISGFFIKGSSFPLLISIALSVAVAALIMYGWSRRAHDGLDDEEEDSVEEIEIAEDEAEPAEEEEEPVVTVTSTRKRSRRRATADETTEIESDDSLFAPPTSSRPAAKPKTVSKPKAASKPKAKAPVSAKKAPPRKTAGPRGGDVAVVPGASRYHRSTCRFAKSDKVRIVPTEIARKRGYLPCDVCKP